MEVVSTTAFQPSFTPSTFAMNGSMDIDMDVDMDQDEEIMALEAEAMRIVCHSVPPSNSPRLQSKGLD